MWDIVIATGIVITVATCIPVFRQMRSHPRGIQVLFFTEMWERFSYYGMRAILVTYMTQHFLFDDGVAQGQYGAYTSLVYLLPLVGGFVADKYLGTRKAIAFGALLLVAGHLLMAVEQAPATQTLTYQGQTYEFAAEGRQDRRQTWIVVDGARYEYGPADGGGIAIEGLPAAAPLPSVLPAGSYEMSVEGRNPLFVNIFYLAMSLHHHGRRLPEAEHLDDRRSALRARRPAPRRGFHALLLRHQSRRVLVVGVVRGPRRDGTGGGPASGLPASACSSAGACSCAAACCSSCRALPSCPSISARRRIPN